MIKEVAPLFKYENFFNWVEESFTIPERSEEIMAIMQCYQDSIYFNEINKTTGAAKTEEEKKNLIGMT